MIDVETKVFDFVYPYVTTIDGFPANSFKSQFVLNPESFPFATLMEMDNFTDTRHRGTADREEYAIITYEANAYALSKPECRKVMDAIDAGMSDLGFNRISMQFIPNLADISLFRLTARYQAAVNNDHTIFRRR